MIELPLLLIQGPAMLAEISILRVEVDVRDLNARVESDVRYKRYQIGSVATFVRYQNV